MGQLVDGIWHDEWYDTESTGGRFQRSVTAHRNWVTADGSPGPTGEGGFPAESGRYHLYVSYACPWAHRTLIFRALKGLAPHIDVSVVHPDMLSDGWSFASDFPGATGDRLFGLRYLRDIYLKADPHASGRVTVPVLWDKKTGTIVSNESAEIIRMFNSAFNGLTGNTDDYWPEDLRPVVSRMWWKLPNSGLRACNVGSSQAARSRDIGTRG